MAKFINTEENLPVNLDLVTHFEWQGNEILFWKGVDDIVLSWKFQTEQIAFNKYNTLLEKYAEIVL